MSLDDGEHFAITRNASRSFPRAASVVSSIDAHSTAPDKVRYILSDGDQDSECPDLVSPSLFTQFDVLVHFKDGTAGWKEITRWLKYEETVEVGDRWSKPHVPTTSMHGLLELKRCIMDGTCLVGLGLDTAYNGTIADVVARLVQEEGRQTDIVCQNIRDIIQFPHKHKHRKASKKQAPDDGRKVSLRQSSDHQISDETGDDTKQSRRLRRRSGESLDIAAALYNYPPGTNPSNLAKYKPNKNLTKKLPKNSEAANILVGQVDFLSDVVMAFCRLDTPSIMADLTEVAIPTRFAFVILGPKNAPENAIWEYSEIARAMAALLNDKVFCELAYKSTTIQDFVDGIEEYIDGLTVLPPSIWDPSTRLEPPKHTVSMEQIRHRLDPSTRGPTGPVTEEQEEGAGNDESLIRTGRPFGGLFNDIRNRYRYFGSDIIDGFHPQCLASTIFLFFACIAPIVTFGGLMGQKTDNYMGTMETLLSGAVCGSLYALFSGQPLTLVGSTGPLLIFESVLYALCRDNKLDFMSFRFWIGIWVIVALLVIVAFDLSALVRYITRFTEESFAVLVSVIFIYEAFVKVAEIWSEEPVRTGVIREDADSPWRYECFCEPLDVHYGENDTNTPCGFNFANWTERFKEECITFENRIEVRHGCITERQCYQDCHWNLTGLACHDERITHAIPDVFFVSLLLFFGTFALAMALRNFRTSPFFPSVVRSTVGDFSVVLSILVWTAIDYALGIATPKLEVPAEFKPTSTMRGWIINPMAIDPWWMIFVSILPALLATILVFLDQQITAVIVNRKEHKLLKPHGYHLDIFVLAFLIGICSILGLPWFVAATVQAVTHVKSLMRESEVKIPGERPQIVGVREQRLTGVSIHVLIGLSTLLTDMLRLIPMPVLYGVFLYMGITSLRGVQFVQRVLIYFMPVKYQPDYTFLRHVKLLRVHIFTLIQLVCMGTMWAIKTIKVTAIGFPVMLIALMLIRKLLDYGFTQSDLYWLDHLLPDDARRAKEDEASAANNQKKSGALNHGFDGLHSISHDVTKEKEALGHVPKNDSNGAFISQF